MNLRGRTSRFAIALAVVALAAFAARVWGNGFGLPFLYHEDEGEIVRRALRMPIDGPNPHWFQYPTLYVYVQAAVYLLVYVAQRAAGIASSYADFASASSLDPTAIYRAGRTVTAAVGAATVVMTGLAGRRLASLDGRGASLVGLAAAAFVAVDTMHVEHSHYVTADVPLTLAAACVLYAAARLASAPDGGAPRDYAFAGAAVGLAASIKYPGALLAVVVVAVYAQRVDWRDWRARVRDLRLPTAAAASVGAFLAGSPFVVLSFSEFLRDFAAEAAHMRSGHLGFEAVQNHWGQLFGGVYASGGLALVALLVVGAFAFVRRRDPLGIALVVTTLTLFVFAGLSNVLFTRYLLPILPVAAIVAARGAHALAGALTGALARGRVTVAVALAALACTLPAFLDVHRLRLFTAPDTRTLARTWVDETVDGRIAVEWKSIPTGPLPLARAEAVPVVYDLDDLRDRGVRYVVVTDRLYRRFLRAPDRYDDQTAFYRELLSQGRLVCVFSPYEGEIGRLSLDAAGEPAVVRGAGGPQWRSLPTRALAGPVIEIYEIPPAEP